MVPFGLILLFEIMHVALGSTKRKTRDANKKSAPTPAGERNVRAEARKKGTPKSAQPTRAPLKTWNQHLKCNRDLGKTEAQCPIRPQFAAAISHLPKALQSQNMSIYYFKFIEQ